MENKITIAGYSQLRVSGVANLIEYLIQSKEIDPVVWKYYKDDKKVNLATKYAGVYNVYIFIDIMHQLIVNKEQEKIENREKLQVKMREIVDSSIKLGVRIDLPSIYRGLGVTTRLAELAMENNYALLIKHNYKKAELQKRFPNLVVITGDEDFSILNVKGFVTDGEIKDEIFGKVSAYLDFKGGLY